MTGRGEKRNTAGIRNLIEDICPSDESQLAVIQSESSRLFVTAPAGYGKTSTMTGRIVYELASGIVRSPQRILVLTFSVSAARKIRNQTAEASKVAGSQLGISFTNRVLASNYHGFARILLSHYGTMIGLTLEQQRELKMHDEYDLINLIREEGTVLPSASVRAISKLQEAIKGCDRACMKQLMPAYNEAMIRLGAEKGWMTYNGLITLAVKLLEDYPHLSEYLRRSFLSVMLDEAQDTNVLHLEFLSHLVDSQTRCCFFGDPSQRIYGFLGAIPDFKEKAIQEFELEERFLGTNHRFEHGSELFLLEKRLRKLMNGDTDITSCEHAMLPVVLSSGFMGQCEDVVNLASYFTSESQGTTVSILFNKRSTLSNSICAMLDSHGVDYFDGLFSDDSEEFISVCDMCLRTLNGSLSKESAISSPEAKSILISLSEEVSTQGYQYSKSYGALLGALASRIGAECVGMNGEDRYQYISDILSTNSLRRYSEFVDSKLTVSTIHSAKGLEWDYVIVPGLSKWDFPTASCSSCPQKNSNGIQISGFRICGPYTRASAKRLRDQINIWYVALTRARKRAIAVSSYERITKSGSYQRVPMSCLLGLPGITPTSPNLSY